MQYFILWLNWQALESRVSKTLSISPLSFKRVKPAADNSTLDHLLFSKHGLSFDYFNILVQGTNMFLLEIKESLLIRPDKSLLNKNISSVPSFSFDKVWYD